MADLIAESYVPQGNVREMRALVRHRLSLVQMRTMVKNKVHAILDKYSYRCEYSDMFGKAGTLAASFGVECAGSFAVGESSWAD
jgi:hypothetical protein